MPRKKKEIAKPANPVAGAMQILAKQAKSDRVSGVSFKTVADAANDWRWIDFADPKTGVPSIALEWLWGARGMLAGRMLKIEAEEGVGKSSYMMLMYGAAQKTSDAWCVHAEGELATAPLDFIASFGVDPARIMAPEFEVRAIDECFNKLDWVHSKIRRKPKSASDTDIIDPDMAFPIVTGVDSVSSFGSAANMDDDGEELSTGGGGLGLHSRFLSQWFRDKWSIQAKRDVFLMVITQLREKISTGFQPHGAPKNETTTLAARPLNYHCSFRLRMRSNVLRHKDGPEINQPYGELVTFVTTKNKLSKKGKQIQIPLIWDHGFDLNTATVNLMNTWGPVQLPGGGVFELKKKPGGWMDVPVLQDKAFRTGSEEEILNRIYANESLLMELREALRIRGFGFKFETDYQPSEAEVEDNTMTETEAAAT
jgi:RecA/RadA recombinase